MDVSIIKKMNIGEIARENKLVICLSICVNLCALAIPIYTLQTYNRILVHQNFSTFVILTVGAFCFILLEFIFRILRAYICSYKAVIKQHVEFVKATKQFTQIKPEKVASLNLNEKKQVIQELSKNTDFIARQMTICFVDLTFLAFFILIISMLSLKLSLAILLILSGFAYIGIQKNKMIIKQYELRNDSDNKRMTGVINVLRTTYIAKMFANEKLLIQKQDKIERQTVKNTYILSQHLNQLLNLSSFTTQIILIVSIGLGTMEVIAGQLNFSALIAIVLIVGRFTTPIREVLTIWFRSVNYVKSNEKLNEFYNQTARKDESEALKLIPITQLTFSQVAMRASVKTNNKSIKQLNFELSAGQSLALTDINSYQRAQLMQLLTGAIQPHSGHIYLNGVSLYQLSSELYTRHLAYINPIEQFIQGSIYENITTGQDIEEYIVDEVCQLFGMEKAIMQLEKGFATELTRENLLALPANLRIKIALARLYINKPKCVVIDVDDVNFDPELYSTLINFIAKIWQDSALLFITNDNNLIKLADKCFSLKTNYYLHANNRFAYE